MSSTRSGESMTLQLSLTIGTPEHTEALRSTIRTLIEGFLSTENGTPTEPREDIINLLVLYYNTIDFHVTDLIKDHQENPYFLLTQYDLLETLRRGSYI